MAKKASAGRQKPQKKAPANKKATAAKAVSAKPTAKKAAPAAKSEKQPKAVKAATPVPTIAEKPAKAVKQGRASSSGSVAAPVVAAPVIAKSSAGKAPADKKSATKVTSEPVEAVEPEVSKVAEPEQVEAGEKAGEKKTKRRDDLKIDRTGNFEQQWKTLFEKSKGVKPLPYKMSDNFEARTPLLHKVLGWGYVLTSQNNRLEVLFKDGIKILIANYKG